MSVNTENSLIYRLLCHRVSTFYRAIIWSWGFCVNEFWKVTRLAQQRKHHSWIQEVKQKVYLLNQKYKLLPYKALFLKIAAQPDTKFRHKTLIIRLLKSLERIQFYFCSDDPGLNFLATTQSTSSKIEIAFLMRKEINCQSKFTLNVLGCKSNWSRQPYNIRKINF